MQEKSYKSKDELLTRANEVINIPFGEIDKTNRLSNGNNKGGIGQLIEESWFGLKVNSRPEPDVKNLGIDIKVTPFKKNAKGKKTAKERLVLNIINYMTEVKFEFDESHFWYKNQKILLLYYEYLKDIRTKDLKILAVHLLEYPEKDLIIIKQDWQKIIKKIKEGKAHELSEGDTLYLGACTKGAGGDNDYRTQPFNTIKAKQRAFCLKQSYMTHVLNNYVFKPKGEESIVKDESQLEQLGFEEYIENKFKPYYGRSQESLANEFNISLSSKNINNRIVANILGVKGNIKDTEEFKKASITPKAISISKTGRLEQSVSFPAFDFKEIIEESWEESQAYIMFAETKFLFFIFDYDKNGTLIFDRIKFWNIPAKDLDEVKKVWLETVKIIKEGVRIWTEKDENGKEKTFNNLPGMAFNRVCHVRPHASVKADTNELPDGRSLTKQGFWLGNKYVLEQITK